MLPLRPTFSPDSLTMVSRRTQRWPVTAPSTHSSGESLSHSVFEALLAHTVSVFRRQAICERSDVFQVGERQENSPRASQHTPRAPARLRAFPRRRAHFALTQLSDLSHPSTTPKAVFKTNAISTVLTQGGLFPSLSRVNSSCRPNLRRPVWDKAAGVIRSWALRDIEVGEELVRLVLHMSLELKPQLISYAWWW